MASQTLQAYPSQAVVGDIHVPGDKSISHRAIMLSAIAQGSSQIDGFLSSADCLATLAAMRQMGVAVEQLSPHQLLVHGVGLHGLLAPKQMIDVGNAGTSIRLLTGLLAGQHFSSRLTGDASLQRRPMERVAIPLRQMGATIATSAGTPPIDVTPATSLSAIHYTLPVASAQVKSAILLAGLYAEGTTTVVEPLPSRDHTELMLQSLGYPVDCDGGKISLTGKGSLKGTALTVPGDISSAAFFIVAASIIPGSRLTLRGVGINPRRTGVIDILQAMGASIDYQNIRHAGLERIADIIVEHRPLRGITIPAELVPKAIDEFPIIFIAAACAEGETVLRGASELRVKESDRLQAMVEGLNALHIDAEALPDGAIIKGGKFVGACVDSLGDHRIAMAFAIAAARSQTVVTIKNCENIATSFPNFVTLAREVGCQVEVLAS